jgi:hypothetical protein
MSGVHIKNIARIATAISLAAVSMVCAILTFPLSSTGSSTPAANLQVISDDMRALTTTVGGATVLPTTRTVIHWFCSTLDPYNEITYGYNMVGANSEQLFGLRLRCDGDCGHHPAQCHRSGRIV